ncbi:LON peptidase substrate-binding domain-containing protein [Pelagibacteraceae bacterium]|jgi:uncharacterized protein|nr:LON peptidase substrate-binding domain-containing protein [Pelagibacteraceae bacterium]
MNNMNENDLPLKIAVFPLSNAVFFPGTILPLNVFEDRYIQLVDDCMKSDRMFGMIQPKNKLSKSPDVYDVGCLGKIISFNETSDKRFVISLSGIIRFRIKKEQSKEKLYRKFSVDYSDFLNDLKYQKNQIKNNAQENLLQKIKAYFSKINYPVEIAELAKLNIDQLISTVCMISPFSVVEKQKLIETITIENKLQLLEEIINFNLFEIQENKTIQ